MLPFLPVSDIFTSMILGLRHLHLWRQYVTFGAVLWLVMWSL